MRRVPALLLFLSLASAAAFASTPESVFDALKKNAEDAVKNGDRAEADFWTVRYSALAAADPASGRSPQDLAPLIEKRKLVPKAFLSGDWDPEFLDWFEKGLYARWAADEARIRMKLRTFEIAEGRWENRYYAVISASPEIELWHAIKDGILSRPLVLFMGSYSAKPTLFFGRLLKGAASQSMPLILDTKKRSLHYVWDPEFFDLDADGTPELWLRYNIAWGNGFLQVLEVYRITEDSYPELIKRFQSGDDGFARRLADGSVELGSAFDSRKQHSRLSNDSHHVETWRYEGREFKKVSEGDIPLVWKSGAWKDYLGIRK